MWGECTLLATPPAYDMLDSCHGHCSKTYDGCSVPSSTHSTRRAGSADTGTLADALALEPPSRHWPVSARWSATGVSVRVSFDESARPSVCPNNSKNRVDFTIGPPLDAQSNRQQQLGGARGDVLMCLSYDPRTSSPRVFEHEPRIIWAPSTFGPCHRSTPLRTP